MKHIRIIYQYFFNLHDCTFKYFWNSWLQKKWLSKRIKGAVSEYPFGNQRVNEFLKLLTSAEKHFCSRFLSLWAKLSLKKLFLARSKILRRCLPMASIFVIIGRIYRYQLKMQLSEIPKTFSCIFTAFLESTLNFKHFEKKFRFKIALTCKG